MQTMRHEVTVFWGDCDPAVIVFYPQYFRWFDEATILLFEQVGLPTLSLAERYGIFAIPIVDAGARFFLPSRFLDRLVVETHISQWSKKSFRVAHQVMRGDQLVAQGHEVRAWASKHPDDPDRFVTSPIPRDVIDLFES